MERRRRLLRMSAGDTDDLKPATIRFQPAVRARLAEHCRTTRKSLSYVVNEAVADYLKRRS